MTATELFSPEWPTMPIQERPDRELCSVGVCRSVGKPPVSDGLHRDECVYRQADRANWQVWYDRYTAWEARAEADIANGRLSAEALDYIDRRSRGLGDITVHIGYLIGLFRDGGTR